MRYYSSPITYQRGAGLGNILSRVFRSIVPIFKKPIVQKGLKRVGSAAINTSLKGLQNHLEKGESLKTSLKRQAIREGEKLLKSVSQPQTKPKASRNVQLNKRRRRSKPRPTRKLDVFDF